MFNQVFSQSITSDSLYFEQTDTIFYNESWEPSSRENAQFYRPPMTKTEEGYLVKDYYSSGVLQMEGVILNPTEKNFEGLIIWYYPNGKVSQKQFYVNGILEGNCTSYREDGSELASAEYKQGAPYSGTVGSEQYGVISIQYYENSNIIKNITSSADSLSKAKLIWAKTDSVYWKLSQYNQFGEFVGDLNNIETYEYSNATGVFATYGHSPLVVTQIAHIKNGTILSPVNYYYTNGKIKKVEYLEENGSNDIGLEIVYNQKGEILDSLTYKNGEPYTGVQYDFFGSELTSLHSDQIERTRPFQKGELEGTVIEYYLNGAMRAQREYKKGMAEGYSIEYVTVGLEKWKAMYKEDEPWEGSACDEYYMSVASYKEGEIVETRTFHSNGKLASYKDLLMEESYDSLGVCIAHLENRNGEPYNGKQILAYNSVILGVTEYVNGVITLTVDYEYGVPTSKTEYALNGDISQTTEYYSTGAVKETARMEGGYEKERNYFSMEGEPIGQLRIDYELGYFGEYITFNSDNISTIEVYRNNEVIRKKSFNEEGKLLSDMDYNGPSVVYDLVNNKEYQCTYQNGLPFEGTEVGQDTYSYAILWEKNYKNGMLEGESIDYTMLDDYSTYVPLTITNYSEGIIEGIQKHYINGVLAREISYSNGYANGPAVFYNSAGEIVAKATYLDDLPQDGVVYEFDWMHHPSVITSYSNGVLHGEVSYYTDNKLDYNLTYEHDETIKSVSYIDGNPKYTLFYKDNQKFEGEEFSYNTYSQYKNGVEILYMEYGYEQPDLLVKKREQVGENLIETSYYSNNTAKSVITLLNYTKEGDATFYNTEGKVIASGVYSDNFPVNGSFAYFNTYDENSYLKLDLQTKKIVVSEYSNASEVSSFQYNLPKSKSTEKLQDEIRKVIDGLSSMYGSYNVESYNY